MSECCGESFGGRDKEHCALKGVGKFHSLNIDCTKELSSLGSLCVDLKLVLLLTFLHATKEAV